MSREMFLRLWWRTPFRETEDWEAEDWETQDIRLEDARFGLGGEAAGSVFVFKFLSFSFIISFAGSFSKAALRAIPVRVFVLAISSGVPCATIWPPCCPASGPRSMT